MRLLIAIDSFKGSMSSQDLACTIEETLLTINSTLSVTSMPIADGGDGMIDALKHVNHAQIVSLDVHGPKMDFVRAKYLKVNNTCIIEMAQSSGLTLLKKENQNPLYTTTYGVGEMLKDAIKKGAKNIIIGVGGSATHDGGIGMLAALGFRFYDAQDTRLDPVGINLSKLSKIDTSNRITIPKDVTINVACDVTNSLTGKDGAAYTYARQKGASVTDIPVLDNGLMRYAKLLKRMVPTLNIHQQGLGAAGGLPLSLLAFFNATLTSGADFVCDLLEIDSYIEHCDLLITGEGKIDHQTLNNKIVFNLLRRAKKYDKPSLVLAGIIDINEDELKALGAKVITSIHANKQTIPEAMLTKEYTKKRLKITLQSLAHYFK